MDYKFKIGDRVRIIDGSGIEGYTGGWVETMYGLCGEIGIVKTCNKTSTGKHYYTLSSENSKIQSWFMFDERELKRANEERKVVITTDGTITRAALYDNHKLIKEAFSTCSKADAFKFETGAKIAFERLTAKPAVKAKPKKELKPLNTKIFVLDGTGTSLKTAHVYNIVDGKIEVGRSKFPINGNLYNMDDVVNYLTPVSLRTNDEESAGMMLSEFSSRKVTVMEVKEG